MLQDPATTRSWGQVGKAASALCVLLAHAQAAGWYLGCHKAAFNLQAWEEHCKPLGHHSILPETLLEQETVEQHPD